MLYESKASELGANGCVNCKGIHSRLVIRCGLFGVLRVKQGFNATQQLSHAIAFWHDRRYAENVGEPLAKNDGEAPASLRKMKPPKDDEWGSTGEDAAYLSKLCKLLAKMKPDDQQFLMHMAQKAARGSNRSAD